MMKNIRRSFRTAIAALACFALVMPVEVLAAQAGDNRPIPQQASASAIADVALQAGGVLVAQVYTAEGTPHAGMTVTIQKQGRELVQATTDANGIVAVSGLQGGVYQLAVGQTVGSYRLWAPGTAPPVAKPGALLVEGQGVVRGQYGGGGVFNSPWAWTAIIATAIVVPIAVANRSSGS